MAGSDVKVRVALAGASRTRSRPNEWVTGRCWLYCRRDGQRVRSLGVVATSWGESKLWACAQCAGELERMARDESRARRERRRGLCEHAELEKRDGKTFCKRCTRQIYL